MVVRPLVLLGLPPGLSLHTPSPSPAGLEVRRGTTRRPSGPDPRRNPRVHQNDLTRVYPVLCVRVLSLFGVRVDGGRGESGLGCRGRGLRRGVSDPSGVTPSVTTNRTFEVSKTVRRHGGRCTPVCTCVNVYPHPYPPIPRRSRVSGCGCLGTPTCDDVRPVDDTGSRRPGADPPSPHLPS